MTFFNYFQTWTMCIFTQKKRKEKKKDFKQFLRLFLSLGLVFLTIGETDALECEQQKNYLESNLGREADHDTHTHTTLLR